MTETTWIERLMSRFGYVPKSELQDEFAFTAQSRKDIANLENELSSMRCQRDSAVVQMEHYKAHGATIHKTAMDVQNELDRTKKMLATTKPTDTEAEAYARELYSDCFPELPVPDSLLTVMEKIHLFVSSRCQEVKDVQAKCLSFIEFADNINETLGLLRELTGAKKREFTYPLPGPEAAQITSLHRLRDSFRNFAADKTPVPIEVSRMQFTEWADCIESHLNRLADSN